VENKNHRKNRKFLLGLLALVFINSALTLTLRGYQRSKNLKILRLLKISLRFVVFNKHQQGGNEDNPSL